MADDFERDPGTEDELPDLVTLSDDEGNEYTFEILDEGEVGEGYYVALQPVFDDRQQQLDDDGQLVIMRQTSDEDGEFLEEIEDEAEFGRVSEFFITRLGDIFDIES